MGIGSIGGVGIGTTISFLNSSTEISEIFIPTQSIYLPNHNLNTGDTLIYNSNGGTPIGVSTNGISQFNLSNLSQVYVGKISNDLIGISTYNIGVGSTGTFIGIGNTNLTTNLLLEKFYCFSA